MYILNAHACTINSRSGIQTYNIMVRDRANLIYFKISKTHWEIMRDWENIDRIFQISKFMYILCADSFHIIFILIITYT